MIDLKSYLFKIDVRAQKDEEKVFMCTACYNAPLLV
nr:exfoliative toxin [Streptococcus marmotae]